MISASFAREDEWMQATRFSCSTDHTLQHRVVLEVMREGVAQADERPAAAGPADGLAVPTEQRSKLTD